MTLLSLSEALRTNRLEEFIRQEETRGIGPVSEAAFDDTASAVIRTPPQDDQTSGSPRSDGSRGK